MIDWTPKAIVALGNLAGLISIVRLQLVARQAQAADPAGTNALLARQGFSRGEAGDLHLMIIGFHYSLNGRRYRGVECPGFENSRRALLWWSCLLVAGVIVAVVGGVRWLSA
jgi:hypothetical protein